MTNVIHLKFKSRPLQRVLYPSVVPLRVATHYGHTPMGLAFMSLSLIFACAVMAPALAYWIDRFMLEGRE